MVFPIFYGYFLFHYSNYIVVIVIFLIFSRLSLFFSVKLFDTQKVYCFSLASPSDCHKITHEKHILIFINHSLYFCFVTSK
jgi:hypothetical protein